MESTKYYWNINITFDSVISPCFVTGVLALQDICRVVINRHVVDTDISKLPLPRQLQVDLKVT